MSKQQNSAHLKYEGCNFFRQRLVLATLSCRPVTISNIRSQDDDPGIRGFQLYYITKIN